MTDTIATRVSRLVAGSAHALLDRAESLAPEMAMAQNIREIEQVIDEVRSDLGKAEAAKHLAQRQIARLGAEHEELSGKLGFALEQARDDLATAAIARQTDIEDLLPVLQRSLDEQSAHSAELESFIVALNAKRRELSQALQAFQSAQVAVGSSVTGHSDRVARVEGAERAFGDVLARQSGFDLAQGGICRDAGKLHELAEMQRQHRIAERLAAAKAGRETR
jgi:phage shock protein A